MCVPSKMIPIYKPSLAKYKKSALEAIESEWISNHGMYVSLAADHLKKFLNIPYCILMNNGTSATHALIVALKYKYPNISKVYVPNHVFIAPWNCALQEYDISCIEVMKTNPNTLNIDTSDSYILSLDRNAAVVIVHNLGNIVNIPKLKRLRPDLIFVEDNCEGLFGMYESIYTGACPGTLCSAVSFYGNKTITTGEGGAFFTHDIDIYKYMKTFFSHGMGEERYVHVIRGTNYRMTNVQAGFLYDQLLDIHTILNNKKRVYTTYLELLKQEIQDGTIKVFTQENDTIHSYWMFSMQVPCVPFQKLESKLAEKNIQIRPLFYDIRRHAHLENVVLHEQAIHDVSHGCMLPSYPDLSREQQLYIVHCIRETITEHLTDVTA